MDKFGRKISLYSTVIANIIFWILVIVSENVKYLYMARIFLGFTGGGIFLIIPLYVSEIASDKIRGTLGAILVLACNFGIVTGFAGGAYVNYYILPYLAIIPLVLFLIGFYRVPDTPTFYTMKNKMSDVSSSLKFFKNFQENHSEVFLCENVRRTIDGGTTGNEEKAKRSLTLKDFSNTAARKGILISTVILLMTQLSGAFLLLNYTSSIFKEAGSNLSPNDATIVVGILQFLGACISTILVDRAGRKLLLSLSSLFTGLCLILMGVFSMTKSMGYDVSTLAWIPIVCLSGAVFNACWGIISLPFLIVSEILSSKIVGIIMSFYLSILWIIAFILLKYFNLLIDILGLHGCMWIFGILCVSQSIFVILVMPETKGKSLDEISMIMNRKK